MSKFRKKPVVIEAWQMSDQAITPDWIAEAIKAGRIVVTDTEVLIPTLEGEMRVSDGDWIICGVKGEFYPCKPDIFAATYEPEQPTASEALRPEPAGESTAPLLSSTVGGRIYRECVEIARLASGQDWSDTTTAAEMAEFIATAIEDRITPSPPVGEVGDDKS